MYQNSLTQSEAMKRLDQIQLRNTELCQSLRLAHGKIVSLRRECKFIGLALLSVVIGTGLVALVICVGLQ